MNISEYKIYIGKLCTMSNNFFIYDEDYIKNKYNLDSYNKFRKYFKKIHKEKLIFNSPSAENFFIKVMNIDSNFMQNKYSNTQSTVIIDYFINKTFNPFNLCEDLTQLEKTHTSSCDCKIKVKSVVNLSINALCFILMENNPPQIAKLKEKLFTVHPQVINEPISKSQCKIIKLPTNPLNKKLIESIKQINFAKNNLNLMTDPTIYELTDTIVSTSKPTNTNGTVVPEPETDNIFESELGLGDVSHIDNLKKYNEQLISDTEDDVKDEEYDEKSNTKEDEEDDEDEEDEEENSESSENSENSESSKDIKPVNKSEKNNQDFKFGLDVIKSNSPDSSDDSVSPASPASPVSPVSPEAKTNITKSFTNKLINLEVEQDKPVNKFGKVIILENKVKLEKKEPTDLNL